MVLKRVDTIITGSGGAPWYNQLFFRHVESVTADQMIAEVANFWQNLEAIIASGNTISVQPEVPIVDEATGLTQEYLNGATSIVLGLGSGTKAPLATQGVIRLRTDGVANGRRVLGKIFVPGVVLGATSTVPLATQITQMNAAINDLIDDTATLGPLVVYSRPRKESAGPPPVAARAGFATSVLSGSAWDQWGVLRSRRD